MARVRSPNFGFLYGITYGSIFDKLADKLADIDLRLFILPIRKFKPIPGAAPAAL